MKGKTGCETLRADRDTGKTVLAGNRMAGLTAPCPITPDFCPARSTQKDEVRIPDSPVCRVLRPALAKGRKHPVGRPFPHERELRISDPGVPG